MKNKSELVIFELVGNNKSSYEDKFGNTKQKGSTCSIPAKAVALDENDDMVSIRYVRTHPSIFINEQTEESVGVTNINRLISKPQFTNGVLVVNSKQKNLLQFLRMHPMNEANQHWGMEKQKPVFRERDAVKIAREINEKNKNIANVSRLIYASDYKAKVEPIADYLGFDISRGVDLNTYDVDTWARNNPDKFRELFDSPIVERFKEIKEALDQDIIKISGQRIKWADGRVIVDVPTNFSPIEYFTEISFEDKHKGTWTEIFRQTSKKTTDMEAKEALESGTVKKVNGLLSLDYDTFKSILKEKGVLEYKAPYFHIAGEQIKGNEALQEYVEANKEILAEMLAGN